MNKDEILETNQYLGKSEELDYIEHKGRKLAFKLCSWLLIFQIGFNMLNGRQSYGLCALFFLYATTEEITKYMFLRKKTSLITIILLTMITVASLVSYINEVIK